MSWKWLYLPPKKKKIKEDIKKGQTGEWLPDGANTIAVVLAHASFFARVTPQGLSFA
jgi:hypothetical protein